MIVFLVIFVIIVSVILTIVEIVNLFDLGIPPKDSDILEMLEKFSVGYELNEKWNDKFELNSSFRSMSPKIHQTQYSIIFPHYIEGVGLVPIWYKSTKIIEQLFKDKIANSKYKTTTREKLGL